jgi:hypothetical protein
VPDKSRPKNLYVNVPLSHDDEAYLIGRGWHPIDVRVLPSKTDADKAETLKAWLEGVRQGSIQLDKDVVKLIELEAKAYGLVGTKIIEKQADNTEGAEETIDDLLDMFSKKGTVRSKVNTKRSHGPKGGHPFTHSNAPNSTIPLSGIFNKKIGRDYFESIV